MLKIWERLVRYLCARHSPGRLCPEELTRPFDAILGQPAARGMLELPTS